MSDSETDYKKFSAYVGKLELDRRFPGLLTVGFAKAIPKEQKKRF